MSEENKQADTGDAESELPDTWDEVATAGKKDTPATAKAEDEPDAEPEGDADGEPDADADEDGKAEDEKPKKPSRSERLRRQNERLKAEIDALRSGSAAPAVEDKGALEAIVTQKVGTPPQEADFNGDWFAFERAMTAYEADKRIVTRQVKEQIAASQAHEGSRIAEMIEDYTDRCAEVAKVIPDFMKVVTSPDFATTDLTKRLILDAGEKAPLVAYHLAQNPRLTAQINAMSPVQAAREIGRIEGRVSLPKNTATRAPAPVNPVRGAASPTRALGKSMSDYEKWRNS